MTLKAGHFLYENPFILVVVIVAVSAPFTHSYKAFDFTTMTGAPNPDLAVFRLAAIVVVIAIVVGFVNVKVKLFLAPTASFGVSDA